MKVQKVMKRIVALGAGALMVGATIGGAMAYSLADYPTPFVMDGANQAKIVVGAAAMTADMLGAVDIATSLQQASVSDASTGTTTVTAIGGKVEDVLIGTALNATTAFSSVVDNTDASFLADSSLTIDSADGAETYDYEENIVFTGGASVQTGLTTASPRDEWKDNVFLAAGKGSVGYRYVFTENIDNGYYIANASSDYPITLDFLGKSLKITSADSDSMTVQVGTELNLNVGDTAQVEGKEVKLVNVGSSSPSRIVVVSVDGTQKTITNSGSVNGLRITVDTTFYADNTAERSATLIVGEESTKSYSNSQEYIGENERTPAWVWNLADLNTSGPTLGVDWDLSLTSYDETDDARYPHALYEGESIKFPHDFAELKFVSLNQNDYQNYVVSDEDSVDLYADDTDGADAEFGDVSVIQIEAKDASNTGMLTLDGEKTDKIALYATDDGTSSVIGVYYRPSNAPSKLIYADNITVNNVTATDLFQLDYKKSTVDVSFIVVGDNSSADFTGTLKFNFDTDVDTDDMLDVNVTSGFDYVGNDDETTDNGFWYDNGTTTNLAGFEENTRTKTGVVVYDPDAKFAKAGGEVQFDMPAEVGDFRANIAILGKTGSASGSSSGAVAVNPIAVGLAILDTDANLATGYHIVVGGPCVNTVAATLMGNPEVCTTGFEEGKATIKYFPEKNAILVAGMTAADTQGASRVLANYGMYTFSGNELEIITTSLNNLQVRTV